MPEHSPICPAESTTVWFQSVTTRALRELALSDTRTIFFPKELFLIEVYITSLLTVCKLQTSQHIAMCFGPDHVLLHNEAALNDYNDFNCYFVYQFL